MFSSTLVNSVKLLSVIQFYKCIDLGVILNLTPDPPGDVLSGLPFIAPYSWGGGG